ncbi:putative ABC transporter, inner membrane subunit [Sulfitobacter noctilucicola]|uniref:Biotin transport system permease protein n=1 Tax=Sulfitobacter noctilucicola TaxID=1342301 RepID=A0A7W6Q4T4_9RHOB|nr:energy-coupling factor transporter transmembrane component T [Sulfitobacter noctilucicola]KIN62417.1 putative ABC transporter, inner membrane subunit [Sulfitobacter noctilucicola]MBB4173050.1 biotin transport system permease protein [Sulfitobacter noctilucicola]
MISLTSPVETAAHHWRAGIKLSALCFATVVLFAADALAWQAAFLIATVLFYALPGVAFLRSGLGRLSGLWPFVVLILIWHLVSGDLEAGFRIVLRMLTAVALANLVTMTTKLSDMIAVVRWLLTPLRRFGVETSRIELAMALVIRFTPVLAAKGQMLTQAWRARSRHRPGPRILIPFAVLAIDDAEHLAEALRARGGL